MSFSYSSHHTPFIYPVHPDPHDYFWYTNEAVVDIFQQAGFSTVRSGGRGNLVAAALKLDATDLPDNHLQAASFRQPSVACSSSLVRTCVWF